mmetsp:Transcript_35222/g.51677  ORF Transcript_35222/g.51677 Transcript_35222/m.51677 type:complete len:378 (+) Transcript_35222:783-1916(+)
MLLPANAEFAFNHVFGRSKHTSGIAVLNHGSLTNVTIGLDGILNSEDGIHHLILHIDQRSCLAGKCVRVSNDHADGLTSCVNISGRKDLLVKDNSAPGILALNVLVIKIAVHALECQSRRGVHRQNPRARLAGADKGAVIASVGHVVQIHGLASHVQITSHVLCRLANTILYIKGARDGLSTGIRDDFRSSLFVVLQTFTHGALVVECGADVSRVHELRRSLFHDREEKLEEERCRHGASVFDHSSRRRCVEWQVIRQHFQSGLERVMRQWLASQECLGLACIYRRRCHAAKCQASVSDHYTRGALFKSHTHTAGDDCNVVVATTACLEAIGILHGARLGHKDTEHQLVRCQVCLPVHALLEELLGSYIARGAVNLY